MMAAPPTLTPLQREALLHQDGAVQDDRVVPESGPGGTAGKIFYVVSVGWWLGLLYAAVGFALLATVIGFSYALPCFNLGWYMLWPFDKHVLDQLRYMPLHQS